MQQHHERGSVSELLKSIPAALGIRLNEEPEYQVLEKEGDIEIRCYEAMTLAQYILPGEYDSFREAAFTVLADYFFGQNDAHEKMPMTQPVFLEKIKTANWEIVPFSSMNFEETGDTEWMMSFALPRRYDQQNAPRPTHPNIQILSQSRALVAVLTYSGNNTLDKIQTGSTQLMAWLSQNPTYQAISAPVSAQYDQPATLSFLKRNEIHIQLTCVQ
jgi:hypothetical protein